MNRKPFFPIVLIFIIVSLLLVVAKFAITGSDAVFYAALAGNFVLFIATFFSFQFYRRGLKNANIHAFIRSVYGAMYLKMGICIVSVLIYAFAVKPVSNAAVAIFFGLYFIYTFAEVKIVTRLNKQNKNA